LMKDVPQYALQDYLKQKSQTSSRQ
jgi:hypothetical protein